MRTVLGRVEIAALLEVDARTPCAWYARGLLPRPDHDKVNGSMAWNRDTIITWAAQTGRLPDSLCVEAVCMGLNTTGVPRGGREAARQARQAWRSAHD